MSRFFQTVLLCSALAISVSSPTQLFAQEQNYTATDGATSSSVLSAHKAGDNATIKSSVEIKGAVAPGTTVTAVLTLKDSQDKPVGPEGLKVMHTEKVHLLIVDPSLGDYHHIHPKPTVTGSYEFEFTPRKSGKYLVFADLVPTATNKQEYSISSFDVPGTPEAIVKQADRSVKVNGYTFDLSFDKKDLVQGDSIRATLKVTGPDGKPFDKLEPVMGAYAHMVAFSENRDHIAHIHPQGKEPEHSTERGGPELTFYMNITQPGYHLLYSQVQIDGKDVFAPFGLEIAPRQIPNNVAGIFKEVDVNMDRLGNVIDAKSLDQVHGLAFWIRDLVSGLPAASDVPAEAKTELNASIKRIHSYADLLDQYGDSHQAEQTAAVYSRFQAEVEKVRKTAKAPEAAASDKAVSLNNANCPVSKMPVGSMEPGAALVYNGQKIGLCCSGCKETFLSDPETYLKAAKESVK